VQVGRESDPKPIAITPPASKTQTKPQTIVRYKSKVSRVNKKKRVLPLASCLTPGSVPNPVCLNQVLSQSKFLPNFAAQMPDQNLNVLSQSLSSQISLEQALPRLLKETSHSDLAIQPPLVQDDSAQHEGKQQSSPGFGTQVSSTSQNPSAHSQIFSSRIEDVLISPVSQPQSKGHDSVQSTIRSRYILVVKDQVWRTSRQQEPSQLLRADT